MGRHTLVVSLLVWLFGTAWVFGQARTGEIYGVVTDPDGKPLPGVTVTLESPLIGKSVAITGPDGTYRFVGLPPAKDYVLRFTLEGFRTVAHENIEVLVGVTKKIDVQMAPGAVGEVVVAGAPPVVDVKKTQVAANFTREVLQSLPTARDPWVILEMAPGVMVDRANVGGSQSGQQSGFTARGASFAENIWQLDGINVTDPAAVGASAAYYDFDSFEELQITSGGEDVEKFLPGVTINMVTRRGGNKLSGTGRIFWTIEKSQSDNTEDVKARFINPAAKGSRVGDTFDYGANFGGPFIRDKFWFWVGYGAQDITNIVTVIKGRVGDVFITEELEDKTWLDNITAKTNAQLGRHNLEFLLFWTDKRKIRREAGPDRPEPTTRDQKGPSPFFKVQDEFFWTDDLYVSLKANLNLLNFQLIPRGGLKVPVIYDRATGVWDSSWLFGDFERPTFSAQAQGIHYKNDWLGGDHELKVGAELFYANAHHFFGWGNGIRIFYNDRSRPDRGGTFEVRRYGFSSTIVRYWSLYAQDTYRTGRFTVNLGLRWDIQQSGTRRVRIDAHPLVPALIPAQESTARTVLTWHLLSPRLGVTWDLFGDGKTILKASTGLFPDVMGTGWAVSQLTTGEKWFGLRWFGDRNGNGVPDFPDELIAPTCPRGTTPIVINGFPMCWEYRNFDPANPDLITTVIDKDFSSPKTLEFTLSLERQVLQDLGVALTGIYRTKWDVEDMWPYDPTGQVTEEMLRTCWVEAGRIPAEWGGYPYYMCPITRPVFNLATTNPGYRRNYWGVDLRVTKRMSHGWLAYVAATLQSVKEKYGARSFFDPTNVEQLQKQQTWTDTWGSALVNARWMVKAGLVARLPLDFRFGVTALLREGYLLRSVFRVSRPSFGWGSVVDVYTKDFVEGKRHPTYLMVNVRLERPIRLGRYGRLDVLLEGFNILNADTEYQWFHLANRPADYLKITEIVPPRIFRLGFRYSY